MNQDPTNNNSATNLINDTSRRASEALTSVKNQINDSFSQFSNQPNAPSEFSFSNTIIAKFAFLLLVIILFLFFVNLGINLIAYSMSPGSNPFLVKGLQTGNFPIQISQDPTSSGSVTLLRSNNQSTGAEFTWSIWLKIDDLTSGDIQYQHIFNKGDNSYDKTTGVAKINNAPGLYLGSNKSKESSKLTPPNSLHIVMDTVGNLVTSMGTTNAPGSTPSKSSDYMNPNPAIIDVANIPLKNWFHVAIRLENSVLDVYVNGTIDQREVLDNVPKQNYFPVNICQNGGFQGSMSDLRYFNSALNVFQINTIVSQGPNMNTSGQAANNGIMKDYHYLSNLWYPN